MSIANIINVVAFVLCVVLFIVTLYFKCKGSVVEAVSQFIAMAEKTDLCGEDKMRLVVSRLYEMVPAAFKNRLSEEELENIAQWIFDWMRQYANAYIDGFKDKENPDLSGIEGVNMALAADMVDRLSNMGSDALKALATTVGIDVSGLSENDIVKAIVLACLAKS